MPFGEISQSSVAPTSAEMLANEPILVSSDNTSLTSTWGAGPTSADWDAFVESCPNGHHEQTSLWGQVRSRFGWQILRLVVREESRIVAGVQMMIRSLGRLGRVGYVTYGPIFGVQNPDLRALVIRELRLRAKSLGLICLVLGLPYDAESLAPQLVQAEFFRKAPKMPPKFLAATYLIDLTNNPEEILGRMRPHTRRNIRLAARKGIRVVEGSASDVGTFRRLMDSLCDRRQTAPNPPQPDFFCRLWEGFHPRGWIRLFLAFHGEEAVSGALAFPFGEYVRVWKVGWSGRFGQDKPNEALWWAAIQWAQRNAFRYFDFVGIDAEYARARITEKGEVPRTMNEDSFKLGFGGDVKLLPGAYCYSPNPIIRTALRCGLPRLLATPAFVKAARSIWQEGYRIQTP